MKTLMRKLIQILCGLVVVLLFSCTPLLEVVKEGVSLSLYQTKMDEVAKVWDTEVKKKGEPDREADGTWLNFGFRYPYAVLKEYASLEKIQEAAGLNVFVSGPHTKDLDFNSETSFGHYNAAFVAKTLQALKGSNTNITFKTLGQQVYDKNLKSTARAYYKAYQYVNSSPQVERRSKSSITIDEVMKTYKEYMKEPSQKAGGYIQDVFGIYANNAEKEGLDWYISNVATGFWVRRKMDNTDKEFFELLEYIVATYDADFK